ncbi:uncharacterized protein LOC123553420 [Mercenaria mercenaria]|uniref:uncharacterized protein LOC123553420 n=1 Tax=Mercenaria mercenaria TaxID=6596 RepID=UPI00234F5DE9|nr:uncharacterized protein LOC123553420 [Mercenaria mercenaria]
MYYLLGLLYMFILPWYHTATEPAVIYSGNSVCNQTVVLGSSLFSALVDFSLASRSPETNSTFSCNFRVETVTSSLIAIKFLSPLYSPQVFDHYGCRTKMIITSDELNIKQCNSIPQTELSSHEYVDVRYEIQGNRPAHKTNYRFKMLLFTYSFLNRAGTCQVNETYCIGTRRCIYEPLKCSRIYDYCNNNMKNCPYQSSRRRPASFSGVYIFISCLIFLLGVTIYMCFCRGIHFFECICHCCSALETTGSQRVRQNEQENDLTRTGNGNGEGGNVIVTTENDVTDNENENENETENASENENETENASENDSINSGIFGLPPSYSYIERNAPEPNLSDSETYICSASEQAGPGISKCSAELPPSYSTVLGHEEEYNVHII